ncbi:MAG: hypothetical protein ACI4CZ_08820 [Hominisplanchenecus sp.]
MSYYGMGVVCGILVGLLLMVVFLKLTKTDGSLKCKYDERQQLVRGKGFQYAFFTLMIYDVLFGIREEVFGFRLVEDMTGVFIGIILGCMVYAVYCIWHDGYYSLNENRGRVQIVFLLIGLVNFLLSLRGIIHGTMMEDGVLTAPFSNLFCAVLMFALCGVTFVKGRIAGKETDDI